MFSIDSKVKVHIDKISTKEPLPEANAFHVLSVSVKWHLCWRYFLCIWCNHYFVWKSRKSLVFRRLPYHCNKGSKKINYTTKPKNIGTSKYLGQLQGMVSEQEMLCLGVLFGSLFTMWCMNLLKRCLFESKPFFFFNCLNYTASLRYQLLDIKALYSVIQSNNYTRSQTLESNSKNIISASNGLNFNVGSSIIQRILCFFLLYSANKV